MAVNQHNFTDAVGYIYSDILTHLSDERDKLKTQNRSECFLEIKCKYDGKICIL